MSTNLQVALYLRVSTKDKDQDPQNQLLQLQAFCNSKDWKVEQIYEDRESAAAGRNREAYQRLFRDAASPNRKWNLLLFWSLDRFSRAGAYATLDGLRQLDSLGVRFLSLQEQYLDTLGPFREAVIAILGAVASLERDRISQRVKAGIAWGKLQGQDIRPETTGDQHEEAQDHAAEELQLDHDGQCARGEPEHRAQAASPAWLLAPSQPWRGPGF